MTLHLREAAKEDMDTVFYWASEETVRKNAFHTEPIPYENHVAWYTKRLADEDCYIFLLETEVESIGQIRFDIEDGIATIDYSVAVPMRGKGYGTRLVQMGMENLTKRRPDVKEYLGQVKYENSSSSKVFEKCGFTREEKAAYIEFKKRVG